MVEARWHRACLSVLALPLLAGCGTQQGTDVAEATPDYAAIEARADQIFTSMGGTARQREAAHFLTVNDLNADFVSCMDEAGFEVASVFDPIYTGWEPNSTEGMWMGELNRALSPQALAMAASSRSEFDGDRGEAYDGAARTCAQDEPPQVNREPEGWLELSTEYALALRRVEEQLGPIDGYTDCMNRAGIDYIELNGEGEAGYAGLLMALHGVMPSAPRPGKKPSAEWTDYLDFEARALEADTSCREEKYHEGLRLLAPELDALEASSGAEIEDMRRQWEGVLEEARRAGLPL